MKRFFSLNINRRGRIVRAVSGGAILAGSVFLFNEDPECHETTANNIWFQTV